ncbi:hypothetical protein SAG0136_04330 [Streptococcus agalactiae LMG 14747]|uniref:Uncharacterized protein n=2 Tax=Streptococcus TaxID=1301 RepID=V6Z4G9_STRAG|nr:hypothetical protein [Streptococcus acidominimus]ESV54489.1 hypothetical protein SAG0136_04330 [Streptococcus agalactiae LMG 14747]SNV44574.1 Uncharacterised protein [Streptococcus acidominimus]
MKTNRVIGLIFLTNAVVLGIATKLWYVGLPMGIIGFFYLIGVISDNDK